MAHNIIRLLKYTENSKLSLNIRQLDSTHSRTDDLIGISNKQEN